MTAHLARLRKNLSHALSDSNIRYRNAMRPGKTILNFTLKLDICPPNAIAPEVRQEFHLANRWKCHRFGSPFRQGEGAHFISVPLTRPSLKSLNSMSVSIPQAMILSMSLNHKNKSPAFASFSKKQFCNEPATISFREGLESSRKFVESAN
jgi:hypothetical protein